MVTIREHANVARDNYSDGSNFIPGELVTDAFGLPIKQVTTSTEAAVDSDPMTPKTYFVEIETTADIRYAVRPKAIATAVPATSKHTPLAAGSRAYVRVYPSAIISFLEEEGD
jgi:hypothetical protein